jgi:membrane associated rhomboid family serine protease
MAFDNAPDGSSSSDPAPAKREPIFSAPLIVIVMSLSLIGLYAAYSFAPFSEQSGILYDFALAPERFWAPAGSSRVYPDIFSGLLTLVSTALLHNDWMHVIVNSLMLLAFGTPVARAFGSSVTGWGLWMIVFLGSVIAGSALYLALVDATGIPAVGASGGTSGLIAAALLLDPYGGKRKLWSREFLGFTLAIAIANALFTLAAPSLLGMYIGWEAHLGGYIAGALLMTVLPTKGYRAAKS